jgi:D-alanyl-lipoteichoic acid acyltransferase DltB (MBOAT superfamily)
LPLVLAWLMTFAYVHVGWVFFRAPNMSEAYAMLRALCGMNGVEAWPAADRWIGMLLQLQWIQPSAASFGEAGGLPVTVVLWLTVCFVLCLACRNGVEIALKRAVHRPMLQAMLFAFLALACVLFSIRAEPSPFLYFNF